ncbi:TPA: glycosyltransferase [Kluyvera georgiana]
MFSVLLSVYVKEKPEFLHQALSSIWDQQSLKPNQIVLVKDGLLNIELDLEINYWKSKLGDILTLVELPENVGLGAALNSGLKHCRYELVARMDTDDVSLPERFKTQVNFMQNNPQITASSAVLEEWDQYLENYISVRKLPTEPTSLAQFARFRSPLSHPVAIFRKSIIESVGGYPPLRKSQDNALWSLLLCKGFILTNLPDTLLKMRSGTGLLDRRGYSYFKHEVKVLQYQKNIGFLTTKYFLLNLVLKAILRLSPHFIKSLAYKLAR